MIGSGYTLGALSWGVPFAALAAGGRRFVQPRVWRWWNVASGVLLGGFALRLVCAAATL